jgi:quercetin dioxygenase-like cupin family protein
VTIFRGADAPAAPADARTFGGPAFTARLAADDSEIPVHVYRVTFESGGRTNWHTHSGPQWLFVIEGRIRIQRWGDRAIDLDTGDAVVFAPGEKHWHGAVPGGMGVHLAVNIQVTTEWLEPVTDADYSAAAAKTAKGT